MHKVFAPFCRAGPEDVPGEGMGLAFVRALLHRLGGRIECHSQIGVGTTFSVLLPKASG
jgi:signal transduction histidine kinase